jgi:hypothetical protein
MTNGILGSFLILVGCCLLFYGFRKVFVIRKLKRYGLRVEGVVIDIIKEIDDDSISYTATIKAQMPNGDWVEGQMSSGNRYDYSIGQKVDVFIDKNNPKHFFFQLDNTFSSPVMLVFLGIIFILIGIHIMLQTQDILTT